MKILLLMIVLAIAGCTDYRNVEDINIPTIGKLYTDYRGNCTLVFMVGEGYSKHEVTLEGKCKG